MNLFPLSHPFRLWHIAVAAATLASASAQLDSKPIILDETGVRNLQLKTALAEETTFEETFFALGHIEPVPAKTASVSSRIAGRITALPVSPGDLVEAGQELARVESRQPGNPPPTIPLTAPIGGMITELDTHLGDPITQDKSLMHITDLRSVHAIAKIPEHQVSHIGRGTRANIRFPAIPGKIFEGSLVRFGTTADEESGTLDAIFLLENSDLKLREGMRAEFSVILSKHDKVLSVPRAALQGDSTSRFVYVKDFDLPNAFVKAPVIVGRISDSRAEVKGGIFPMDEVVTEGAYSLSFAGAGTISLKEALDAAHGHEHAEDGSELSGNEKPKDHAGHGEHEGSSPIWKYLTLVLGLLLIASLVGNKLQAQAD